MIHLDVTITADDPDQLASAFRAMLEQGIPMSPPEQVTDQAHPSTGVVLDFAPRRHTRSDAS